MMAQAPLAQYPQHQLVSASLSSSPSSRYSCSHLSFSRSFSTALSVPAISVSSQNNARRKGGPCVSMVWETVQDDPLAEPPVRERKKFTLRHLILKPPLSDTNLAERFLGSPQLRLKRFPLLSACLPLKNLTEADQEWIDKYLLKAKKCLGYEVKLTEPEENKPETHLDTLIFLAFQHKFTPLGMTKWVRTGHSRLAFLGQYVTELAFCELLLQMYPREGVGCLRERAFNVSSRRVLYYWFSKASMVDLVFPTDELMELRGHEKQLSYRGVFWALVAVTYLTSGMPKVYQLLFEVFGMDLDAPTAQPRERTGLPDVDFVSPDLEGKLTWQDIAFYKPPSDALFASPRLFRSCVPPGMHRFRGNTWEIAHLPTVRQTLGYPLSIPNSSPEMTTARNLELDLGLQLSFLHPSMFKGHHPRFCFDRLEYLGSKIQDVVGVEQLLIKHLDGPGHWLERKHRLLYMNRLCGRTLRDKKLHHHISYGEEFKDVFETNRRMRNFCTTSVQQSIHAVGYTVYGRSEVRRLMFEVFPSEGLVPAKRLYHVFNKC